MKVLTSFAYPFVFAAILGLGSTIAFADERPPSNALPLAEIIVSLEAKGYTPITEISLDRGMWEVEAYRNNEERELIVNPLTGEVLSDRLDR